MATPKKSYCTVIIGPTGELPISTAVRKNFDLRDGDLAGLRRLPRGQWELTFWRKLYPKGLKPNKIANAPDEVAIVRKVPR